MERGKKLLWPVSGGVIAGLGAVAYLMTDRPAGVRVGFGVGLVLSYCMFRRQAWPRWVAVPLVAAAGLLVTVFEITALLLEAMGAVKGTSWEDGLSLLTGVTFLALAGILAFSEAIGDFFGWVPAGAWTQPPADAAAAQAARA
jgi:hypothetical protein